MPGKVRTHTQTREPVAAKRDWRLWAFLILAVVAVSVSYAPLATNDFINYDDPDYVTANPHVQNGLTASEIKWAVTSGHASNWHPLTWVSHMLDWQLFGAWAGGHHLISLALHATNAVLLFLFLWRATGERWRGLLVAAFFALHPLHVESVAWVSERKDVLSTLFFLLTLLAYAEYAGSRAHTVTRKTVFYALALSCFALGLMSKPMLVTVPCVLLLLDYWPLRRIGDSGTTPARLRFLLVEKLPFLALSLGSSLATLLVQQRGGSVSASISLVDRLANVFVSYARYLGKTFWPSDLAVLYPHPVQWPVWYVIVSVGLFAAVSGTVVWFGRRRPYLPVGWFWFVGTLVPVLGLVQVGLQSMADRYSYIPHIGLFMLLVWGAEDMARSRPILLPALSTASLLLLLGCAALTRFQVGLWKDSETLFRHTAHRTHNNYLAFNNLGHALAQKGQYPQALESYTRSLKIKPDYEEALNNYGHALGALGRHADAIPYYERALRTKPRHPEVLNNLGNALAETGRVPEAVRMYEAALQASPNHADSHNNLGVALALQGKLPKAIEHFEKSLQFRPNHAGTHSNLGNAYAVSARFDDAVREYRQALHLNPSDPQAHNNLGNVLAQLGNFAGAKDEYLEAIRLNPKNPETLTNLARTLLAQGQPDAAVGYLKQALVVKPDYAPARLQLDAIERR